MPAERTRRFHHCPPACTRLLVATLVLTGCGARADDRAAGDSVAGDSARAAAIERPAPVPVLPQDLGALRPQPGAVATRIDVRRDTTTFGIGPAVVTLSTGDTLVVADSAVRVWKLGTGRLVAVSGLDGAGGFENEGQSLTVIDVQAGTRRRVVADYFPILGVELLSAAGRDALLVRMRDGGQGSLHVTVVDPKRGQVFRALNALGRVQGDRILVAGYGDGEEPVVVGDRRTPLRVDTLSIASIDTLSLLVVPRGPR
ncbi:MAG: hypothetical protein IT355_01015 [Gemmatimonadaceae bacterium]|nr:hypothetical protein [Gemmatimonadaceae bacterium]